MCLHNSRFSLKFFDGLGYIGYGWKAGLTVPKIGEWYEAKGWGGTLKSAQTKGLISELTEDFYSEECVKYPAGFHIFLNRKDAEYYGSGDDVYQVAFSEVLAFGDNETTNEKPGEEFGPCVVARHIFYFPSDGKKKFFKED